MDNNNFDESVVNQNDDVEQQVPKELTKKEKAEKASKDIADITARGLGRYFGGNAGGAAVDTALKTKWGQGIQKGASKVVANTPGMKGNLARSYGFVNKYKDTAHQVLDKMGSTSYDSSDSDNVSNNDTNIKDKGVISGLWEKLPLKTKLIIIGVIAGLILLIIFLVVLITPLMHLGYIDIEGIGNGGDYVSMGTTYPSSTNLYWWPVGSNETEEKNGVIYSTGQPYSTDVIREFDITVGSDSYHTGVDISSNGASVGVVNVIAVKSGEVIYPTDESLIHFEDSGYPENTDGDGYGNYVKIKHNDGSYTLYAHLAKDSINVMAGDVVSQGQVIGKIGNSGNSTGNYLHFEVRIGSDSQSGLVNPLNYIESGNARPSSYGTNDAFSVTTTALSKNEFISRMNDYCERSNNKNFCNNFSNNAALVYDASIENNVNPELVVVTAGTEQNWKNACSNNNYWGIGVTNTGGGCGASYSSLSNGIAGYGKLLNDYTTKNAEKINDRYEQRKNANCDPAGHGPVGTLVGMQSMYSWVGSYRYNPGDWSLGGCVYLNIIYGKDYCSNVITCKNKNNCSKSSATTVCEQNDYTAYQVKQKVQMRYDIFGI